jgi:hypothetical protein
VTKLKLYNNFKNLKKKYFWRMILILIEKIMKEKIRQQNIECRKNQRIRIKKELENILYNRWGI